jgi:WD40 repeat protein/uncharacterized caspase-like protein
MSQMKKAGCLLMGLLMVNFIFSQQPKLMLSYGHSSEITSLCFSPDNKYVLTASMDETAKIWSVPSGDLLADFTEHTAGVYKASFHGGGKYVLTISTDSTAKWWNCSNGALLFSIPHIYKEDENGSFEPAVSHNCKSIAVIGIKGIGVWSLEKKTQLFAVPCELNAIENLHFSTDDNLLLVLLRDGSLITCNMTTHTFNKKANFFPGGSRLVYNADHSSYLTVAGNQRIKVWRSGNPYATDSLPAGNELVTLSASGNIAVTQVHDTANKESWVLNVWRLNPVRLVKRMSGGPGSTAVVSDDDRFLFLYAYDSSRFQKCDLNTGTQLFSESYNQTVLGFCVSSDGSMIAVAPLISVVPSATGYSLIDANTGKEKKWVSGSFDQNLRVEYSPDNKYVMTSSYKWGNQPRLQPAMVYDLSTGEPVLKFCSDSRYGSGARYGPGGKTIITVDDDSLVKVFDAYTGELKYKILVDEVLLDAGLSHDGKKVFIVAGWESNAVTIAEAITGKTICHFDGVSDILNFEFSPDDKMILIAGEHGTVTVWNTTTGRKIKTMKQPPKKPGEELKSFFVTFSQDGKKVIGSSYDQKVIMWDALSGAIINTRTLKNSVTNYIRFSPDKKRMLSGSSRKIMITEIATDKVISELDIGDNYFLVADFSPDGKNIITTGANNTYKLWATETGRFLYGCYDFGFGEYVVTDAKGRFDGTPAARTQLYLTCGIEKITLDQVKDSLWVPGLVRRILSGSRINSSNLSDLQICGLIPDMENLGEKNGLYRFRIKPRQGGLKDVAVFVNGIEHQRYLPGELVKEGDYYIFTLNRADLVTSFVAGAENPIMVKAYSAYKNISSRGLTVSYRAPDNATIIPNIYAVMVGVSSYKGSLDNLKYPAKDAQELSNVLGQAGRSLLEIDKKQHVFIYNFNNSDQANIPEKKTIRQAFEDIATKATANDILLVFFSGHGMTDPETRQFKFLTTEASENTAIGITTDELYEWIRPAKIKAQKRVLIVDACFSGALISDLKSGSRLGELAGANDKDGDYEDQLKAIDKLNERSGMYILSAAASNQKAYELERYAMGLLTYALLKAIKEKADILENGKYLSVTRWFAAADEVARELLKELGAIRQDPQIISAGNFRIGLVDKKLKDAIRLPGGKILLAKSNFQNQATLDDNRDLQKTIDSLFVAYSKDPQSILFYDKANEGREVYKLSGIYQLTGRELSMKVAFAKGDQSKEVFTLTWPEADKVKLAEFVVKKTIDWIKLHERR